MPRQLALLACASFVFCLLRYDTKRANRPSWALWLPTLWMLCAGSRPIDVWFGIRSEDSMSGSVVGPFFLGGLALVGLSVILGRRLRLQAAVTENGWLFALLGYMLLSVIWSDDPERSFRTWVTQFISVIMALVVLTEEEPHQAFLSLLRRTVYILIPFSMLLVKYYPSLGVVYSPWTGEIQWVGVTLHKSSLGPVCLIAAYFLVWTLIRRRRRRDYALGKHQTVLEVLLLLMTLWLLKGPSTWAASVSSVCALGSGLAVLFALLWMDKHEIRLNPNTWMAIVACIIGLGTITPFLGGSTITAFTSAVGRDETLTGRTEIWAAVLPFFRQAPFLGSGFAAFWTPQTIRAALGVKEAHNGYLEVLLQLGLVGLLFTVMFLLSTARKAATLLRRDHDWAAFCLCFLVMVAIHNISEADIPYFTACLTAFVLFFSVSLSRPIRRFGADRDTILERGNIFVATN